MKSKAKALKRYRAEISDSSGKRNTISEPMSKSEWKEGLKNAKSLGFKVHKYK